MIAQLRELADRLEANEREHAAIVAEVTSLGSVAAPAKANGVEHFLCSRCDMSFMTAHGLTVHMGRGHKPVPTTSKPLGRSAVSDLL